MHKKINTYTGLEQFSCFQLFKAKNEFLERAWNQKTRSGLQMCDCLIAFWKILIAPLNHELWGSECPKIGPKSCQIYNNFLLGPSRENFSGAS